MDAISRLKKTGEKITKQLSDIRESVGAPLVSYTPHVIDITGKELHEQAIKNKNKPIIRNNQYYFTYIKDNTYHDAAVHDSVVRENPYHCFHVGKKVHFYYCPTLVNMEEKGRRERYRAVAERSNTRTIDLRGKEDVKTRLPWCKHCLKILCRQEGGQLFYFFRTNKDKMARSRDADELMKSVIAHYEKTASTTPPLGKSQVSGLKNSIPYSGYPKWWGSKSRDYRRGKNYKCEKCGVDCSRHTHLVDTHHKNGNKSDNRDKNLLCLCKHCHSLQDFHGHYKPRGNYIKELEQLWKEQNIVPPGH